MQSHRWCTSQQLQCAWVQNTGIVGLSVYRMCVWVGVEWVYKELTTATIAVSTSSNFNLFCQCSGVFDLMGIKQSIMSSPAKAGCVLRPYKVKEGRGPTHGLHMRQISMAMHHAEYMYIIECHSGQNLWFKLHRCCDNWCRHFDLWCSNLTLMLWCDWCQCFNIRSVDDGFCDACLHVYLYMYVALTGPLHNAHTMHLQGVWLASLLQLPEYQTRVLVIEFETVFLLFS